MAQGTQQRRQGQGKVTAQGFWYPAPSLALWNHILSFLESLWMCKKLYIIFSPLP